MRRLFPLLLALTAPVLAQREDDLIAHWRLSSEHVSGASFSALYGQPPLRATGPARFLGDGERQALVLTDPPLGHLASAGRLPSDVLPRRRLTVEGWVAVDRPGAWGGFLGAIEDDGDHERGWLLGHRGDRFCFGLASADLGRLHYLTAPRPFQLGRWYHVAGVYDGAVQTLYVDGERVAEFVEGGGDVLYDPDHLLVAGAYKDSNEEYPLVGGIYELRLWDRALGPGELARRIKMSSLMPVPGEGGSVSGFVLPAPPSVRELQPAINTAIDRGVAWLLPRQHRDGSWEGYQDSYRNGMTALALYTLLKQGLPAGHPSIQNGLAYLRRELPTRTYSAGCMLLALAALDDEGNREWAQEIVDLLVDWENGQQPGGYGYPAGRVDLSNTQYAALGLWAASKLGVEAPRELWQRLVLNACQLHQSHVQELEWEGEDAGQRTGKRRLGGFTYQSEAVNDTGSMTAAGLCILGTARAVLGDKLGRRVTRPAAQGEMMALEWLAENWTVDKSPGGGQHLYYLYGLERVGALYHTEFFGPHEWYRDGAEKLIKMQAPTGQWGSESDTCFALLFLSRATASSTGPGVNRQVKGWNSRDGQVWFHATGNDAIAMWITGFDEGELARRDGQAADRAGLRVLAVEYLADGEVIAEVKGDPLQPWRGERFAARHTFKAFGKHNLRARVKVVPFGDPPDAHGPPEVLDSGWLEVEALFSPEAFQQRHQAEVDPRNQVLELEVSHVQASTEAAKGHEAARAADGREATRWVCANDDAFPWLRMELRQPVRARAVRLSPAASALHLVDAYEAIRQARLIVNGEGEYTLDLSEDGLTWGTLHFERELRVRSLEVRLEARQQVGQQGAGLAEVVLLGEVPRRRRR